ncbi:uncharacterized protein LOC107778819 [Nicotiana tabacum]|uniref:Uncharacterized protein n=3 Tax=Nicotiana TaxID=4085 RepID=A0A1S3YQX0_TOBAC|nr:PREDICTED: uncharacterized protein LOC104247403 [Nicotiana sylvestris]XP_009801716.1 PREDICTED: uncharacterized protein LOC104247403 [Nicotiana sylvestris]XP_016454614.1 PREDICTED: uncharacterized protein LOC107778819 [Nicotiana tabacum]XP_016454615.1 PREDICTED: uncharacterized protein LOC107778819 [Nicotiana tabacum]
MARGTTGRRRFASRPSRLTPYPLPSANQSEHMHQKKCSKIFENKDWEDATCSVCMEYPHNAVLLLCSSHDKGCRPYMCGTSSRYSNCLDQYKKAYTKLTLPHQTQSLQGSTDPSTVGSSEKHGVTELACPLCRGQVKGWTVVKPARAYLNAKKRSCMHTDCSFNGSYKEMRKHVRAEHPCARPREVDPLLEQKWSRLERERERDDVISTVTSSMPGAVVFGDYVIERSNYGFDSEDEEGFDADVVDRNEGVGLGINNNLMNVLLFLQAVGSTGNSGSNRSMRRHERYLNGTLDGGVIGMEHNHSRGGFDYSDEDMDSSGEDNHDNGISLAGRLRREGRVLLSRSGRRRRHREANAGRR